MRIGDWIVDEMHRGDAAPSASISIPTPYAIMGFYPNYMANFCLNDPTLI